MMNKVIRNFLPAKYFRAFKSEVVVSFYDDDLGLLFRVYDDGGCTYEDATLPISSEFGDVYIVEPYDKLYHNPNCDYRVAFCDILYRVYDDGFVAKEVL